MNPDHIALPTDMQKSFLMTCIKLRDRADLFGVLAHLATCSATAACLLVLTPILCLAFLAAVLGGIAPTASQKRDYIFDLTTLTALRIT